MIHKVYVVCTMLTLHEMDVQENVVVDVKSDGRDNKSNLPTSDLTSIISQSGTDSC